MGLLCNTFLSKAANLNMSILSNILRCFYLSSHFFDKSSKLKPNLVSPRMCHVLNPSFLQNTAVFKSSNGFILHFSIERTLKSYLKIVGISFGAVLALCVVVFIGFKCWRKKNRVPHVGIVHSQTNDVATDQEQDTTL